MTSSYRYFQVFGLLSILGAFLVVCICLQSARAQEADNPEPSYENVEERRLHVRIIEEHDQINREKKALLLKEKELEKLREEIDLKLEELDRKLEELGRQTATLRRMQAGDIDTADDQINNISRIYENMDPVKAAIAISDLEPETAAEILAGMRSRSAAKILDLLNSRKATEITKILVTLPR